MERSFTNKHRCKCKLIAFIDLLWRIFEFGYSIVELVADKLEFLGLGPLDERMHLGTILQKTYRTHKLGPHGITMISPLLSFMYILTTLLQVAVSCIMFKACTGKVACEQEEGACNIWIRMSLISLIVAIILFIFPFVQSGMVALTYFGIRISFILLAILIVKAHIRNLEKLLGPNTTTSNDHHSFFQHQQHQQQQQQQQHL